MDTKGWMADIKEAFGRPQEFSELRPFFHRLYEEIARLAGVEDPKARAEQTALEFSGEDIRPETTERLIERLKAR